MSANDEAMKIDAVIECQGARIARECARRRGFAESLILGASEAAGEGKPPPEPAVDGAPTFLEEGRTDLSRGRGEALGFKSPASGATPCTRDVPKCVPGSGAEPSGPPAAEGVAVNPNAGVQPPFPRGRWTI